MAQGRNRGGATPAVHPLTKDISLNRGAFYKFYNGLMPYIISSFLLLIYLRPPLKITQLRPGDAGRIHFAYSGNLQEAFNTSGPILPDAAAQNYGHG